MPVNERTDIIQYDEFLVLMFLVSVFAYVIYMLYIDYINAYLASLIVDEYTYLLILTPLSLIILLHIIYKYFILVGPSFDRILVFTVLFIGSLLFYAISNLRNEYMVQYSGIAFILLVWSFIVLLYKPIRIKYYVFLIILLLIIIPLPISFITYVSANLSHMMGKITAWITNVDYIEKSNKVLLGLIDADGKYRYFEISYACSGIISLTSVLAVLPIIVFIVIKIVDTFFSKLLKTLFMIIVAAGIALIGNLLRLISIIYVAKYISYQDAMELFHQTPSVIYVSLSVLATFYLLRKLFPIKLKEEYEQKPTSLSTRNLIVITLVSIILLSQMYIYVGKELANEVLLKYTPYIPSLKVFLQNPALIIFNKTPVTVAKNIPIPSLTPFLGTSIVQEIIVKYRGRFYVGYVEVAETPARFHGWHICLTFQGYDILRSWSITGNTTIQYLLIERNNRVMLLGYTIYRMPLSIGNKTTPAYIRISLFAATTGNDISKSAEIIKEILEAPLQGSPTSEKINTGSNLFEKIVIIENILVVVNIILILIITGKEYMGKILEYLRVKI